MRRGAVVALVSIALVVAAITTAIAYFVNWLPESASEERQGIDLVLWVTVGICIFVFAVVASVSIYAGVKFRVQPDDESDGPPIHGHTGLEIMWTAVPTVLVTIIAVISAIVLAQNDSAKGSPMRVEVLAQQFAWQFTYPEQGGVKATNLYLPLDRSTKLVLNARGRHPLLLGARVRAEAGRRARDRDDDHRHADEDRELPADLHGALRPRSRAHAHAGDRALAGRFRPLGAPSGPGRRRRRAGR